MFYHRVLPPPSNLTTPLIAGPRAARRDTLLEHRIMTSENPRELNDTKENLEPSREPIPLADQHSYPRKAAQERNQYEPLHTPTRSSTRLSGKRTSSQASSEEDTRRSSKATIHSVSTDSTAPPVVDSPSQVCLCQPDPKVPRPRNGMNLCLSSITIPP